MSNTFEDADYFDPSDLSDEELVRDAGEKAARERKRRADEIWLKYHYALAETHNNAKPQAENLAKREEVRDEMRKDERFVLFAKEISKYNEKDMDWISAIIRSESRAAARDGEKRRLELIEAERLRREREKAEEVEILKSSEHFGMF